MSKKLTKEFQKKLSFQKKIIFQKKLINEAFRETSEPEYALFLLDQAKEMKVFVPDAEDKLTHLLNKHISHGYARGVDVLLTHGVKPSVTTLEIETSENGHNGDIRTNEASVLSVLQVLERHGYTVDKAKLIEGRKVEIKAPAAKKALKPRTP